MLVVLAILGVILAGMTQLFTSALKSQNDQTNRTQAQTDARLGLDKLRREIHCANGLTSSGSASSITITLGSYCPTAGGAAATVTWCTKDKNGVSPPVAGAQPYTLWRYTGTTCSGTGTKWASNLVDTASVTAGKIFGSASVLAPTVTTASSGGNLLAGTYSYDVTAVLSSGAEVPGTVASVTTGAGQTNKITVSWSAYTGSGVVQRVRPRRRWPPAAEERHGGHVVRRYRADQAHGEPAHAPQLHDRSRRHVELQLDREHDRLRRVRPHHVHRDDLDQLHRLHRRPGGAVPQNMPVYNGSTARPPRSTLSVSLALDLTPANTNQRFVLVDNIVLRNSQPF